MKKIHSLLLPVIFFFSLSSLAQRKMSAEAGNFFVTAMSQFNPKHVAWIKSTAKTMNDKSMAATEAKTFATQYAKLNGKSGTMDIEALLFLVLMQSNKNAEEDLRTKMAEMKEINEKKEALREAKEKLKEQDKELKRETLDSFRTLLQNRPFKKTTTLQPVKPPGRDTVKKANLIINPKVTTIEIKELIDKLQEEEDSLTELGGRKELTMQFYMDRMGKADAAASNAMKKFSDVQNSIISNWK